MIKRLTMVLFASVACASAALAQPAAMPAYKITKVVPLGAPDHWDYVVFDSASQRVYVAHASQVDVVDGRSGRFIGKVAGVSGGAHGIAISAANGRGYTDDGSAGAAVVFDLKTLKTLRRINIKDDADAMVYDPRSGHIFVVDGEDVTVIDPATDKTVGVIGLDEKLEYAAAPGDGKLYVNGTEKRELIRIDTLTNTVDARWSTPDCERPHGLALDAQSHRAFISCVNRIMAVVNTDTGAVIANLPIHAGTDAAAFDPKRKLAFSSSGDGTISVIREVNPDTFLALGAFETQATGRTMAVDPQTGRLFVAAADIDQAAAPDPKGRPDRPKLTPGSLKLLFIDPEN